MKKIKLKTGPKGAGFSRQEKNECHEKEKAFLLTAVRERYDKLQSCEEGCNLYEAMILNGWIKELEA